MEAKKKLEPVVATDDNTPVVGSDDLEGRGQDGGTALESAPEQDCGTASGGASGQGADGRAGIRWDWVRAQYEAGWETATISRVHEESFGVRVTPNYIRVRAHRERWSRYALAPGNTDPRVTRRAPPAEAGDVQSAPVAARDGAGGPAAAPLAAAGLDPAIVRANARIAEIEADHRRRLEKLKRDADNLMEAVQERLERRRGLKVAEIRDLSAALQRAADVAQRAIEFERRVYGVDREVSETPQQVTQIAIICNAPPTIVSSDQAI